LIECLLHFAVRATEYDHYKGIYALLVVMDLL
jgi:hypothetical protein